MKRYAIIASLLAFLTAPLAELQAGGPKWAKNANKSLVCLYALQMQGDTLEANAFFTSEQGTLIAPFKTIRQAQSAWITDAQGKRYEICRILGFNTTYNVVRLQAETGKKKTVALPLGLQALTTGETVSLVPTLATDTILQVEKAGNHAYYTLSSTASPTLAGNPVINEEGSVIGILQTPVTAKDAPNYALDIQFAEALSIRPIDANNPELRLCGIPKQLPAEESQAVSFLYLAAASGNPLSSLYADDFITAFPKSATGYIQKAEQQAAAKEYEATDRTYEEGLKQVPDHADELLHSRSKVVYQTMLRKQKDIPETWTLERALTDITAALSISPLPLYTLHEGNVLFALKRYDEAYQRFMAVTQTKMRTAELFLYAWQCKANTDAPKEELLALNDSAVACFTKPYSTAAAPYLLLRSNTLTEMGRLREAITDLNDYEHLMQGQLTSQFYYQREQLEVKTRMYGQAVNDIYKAISLDEEEPLFHAELAVLLYRLNDVDNAIVQCRKAIELDAGFPDAHRLLGICLRDKGDKEGARQSLNKAIELGDELAKGILEKMEN